MQTYSGFETLSKALDAHKKWLMGQDGGSRPNLLDADLIGAELNGANLSGAYLREDLKWERYLAEVVPALCVAGGKTLEEVAAVWDCHNWENCPMHVAFGASSILQVPALYRREAELFIQLFDCGLIPKPKPIAAAESVNDARNIWVSLAVSK
jgi:hypothetical protein